MVRVTIPELAKRKGQTVGFTLAVKPGVTIVSVKGADVLWVSQHLRRMSPRWWFVPVVVKDVVRVATPLASVPVPIDAVPL